MNRSRQTSVFLLSVGLSMLICGPAICRGLSESDAAAIRGKTISSVGRPQVNFFVCCGVLFPANEKEVDQLKSMVGDSLLVNEKATQPGLIYQVVGTKLPDPSVEIESLVLHELADKYSLKVSGQPAAMMTLTPDESGSDLAALQAPYKTPVDRISSTASASDLALYVRTVDMSVTWFLGHMEFHYVAQMALVDTHDKKVLVEGECRLWNRHAWEEKPYLYGFLGNGMAPLKQQLGMVAQSCVPKMMKQSFDISMPSASP